MARKKVAEKNPPAKSQDKTETPASIPRLQVVLSEQAPEPGPCISSPLEAYGVVGREISQADREHFIVLHLDCKNRLLAQEVVSSGSLTSSIVHPREVFKGAVLNGSAAIVCVHNHPSGDPTPSQEDREITARLKQAADLMGIRLADHVIVGKGPANFYSFFEAGAMPAGLPVVKEEHLCRPGEDSVERGKNRCGISRVEAKRIIDAAAARLTFLLETAFSKPLGSQRHIFTEYKDTYEGLSFVIFEVLFDLEDLYCLLYPEKIPEWRNTPKGWTSNPPDWDEPDMSCDLLDPINALKFLYDSFGVDIDDYKKISEQGFEGLGGIVKDVRSRLCDCSTAFVRAIEGNFVSEGR